MKNIAVALCKAQSQIRGAIKDSTNPHFKKSYADLESVWDACRDALTNNGLSVAQFGTDAPDGHIAITTMLLHESGEHLTGTMTLPMVKRDPQAAGSAITYARRYSLAAMVGVVQVDDDANDASNPAPPKANQREVALKKQLVAKYGTPEKISEEAGKPASELTIPEMEAML